MQLLNKVCKQFLANGHTTKEKEPVMLLTVSKSKQIENKHPRKQKIPRKVLTKRIKEVKLATITERESGKFDYKVQNGKCAFLCFRTTLAAELVSFGGLVDRLYSLKKTDFVFNFSLKTCYKLYEKMDPNWYAEQRNLTFNIQNGISSDDSKSKKKCCITAIKYIHRILEAEKRRQSNILNIQIYHYRPLLNGFQDKLSLTTLPSRYYKYRSLIINCKGLYISEENGIKTILTVKTYPNVVKADRSTFEKMIELLMNEDKSVIPIEDGRVFYRIGNHSGTVIDQSVIQNCRGFE